ncbi:MAG: DNA topoisomerase III [Marinobacter sp.]|uniref:DNA topoisomerase III n=1 Tax=Marinobacter sp. TaxID=50741 RepID=UPI00299DFCDB|nr:DNA topoisomerase III [Marinobacter sp.]MDX1633617.1 DNA topoisomerase III [Marinobacter sp.]
MRLFIAEKPSLGRAIAAALPGPMAKGQGFLRCGQGDDAVVVSWCIGHLLEPAEPGQYDPRWQRWHLADLPVFPDQWQLAPRDSARQQLTVLSGLIRKASSIVHAGDPDREGQLLVDEVIRYVGATCPVERVLINDLTPQAVARAISRPEDNRLFRRLSHSALARQRADWLYGINLTRLYTLNYRQQGEQGVYSVGRVQTPVLGLVVQRDQTIAHFEPRPFFRIQAHCRATEAEDDTPFVARWLVDEAYRDYLDEDDRLLDQEVATRIAADIEGRPGTVTQSRFRDRKEPPPLPLSLSVLQIEAGRLFQMAAKDVLDTAQSLYEKHQLITYPRSDCRYLPEGHFEQRQGVVNAITRVAPELEGAAGSADLSLRSAAWNDARVDAHHGIIPTARSLAPARLSPTEAKIYELVARYYLMQFHPDAIHLEGRLEIRIGQHAFRASETAVFSAGWKSLELRQREAAVNAERTPLPRLDKDEPVLCERSEVTERQTQPPQHFTDATLLSAMTHIARFVSDKELRKTLRETDGLGTEATRASIIETLFRRDYLNREGRFIKSTAKGQALIGALPAAISRPDMTARWEATLEQIRQGEGDPRAFIAALKEQIRAFIQQAGTTTHPGATPAATAGQAPVAEGIHCPKCRAPMRKRSGKFGEFHACTRFPACKGTRPLENSMPNDGTGQKPIPCPKCFSPLVRRQGKKGWFWGCSNYPGCRQTVDDLDGKPALPNDPGQAPLLRKSTE